MDYEVIRQTLFLYCFYHAFYHLLARGTSHIIIMNDYEKKRLENIARNRALIKDLGIKQLADRTPPKTHETRRTRGRPSGSIITTTTSLIARPKRKRNHEEESDSTPDPTHRRSSARLATVDRPDYSRRAQKIIAGEGVRRLRDSASASASISRTASPTATAANTNSPTSQPPPPPPAPYTLLDAETLRAGWSSWTPAASPPTWRDALTGEFAFLDRPDFTPNKSPSEILREGAFGGTYFRALRSRKLGEMVIADDWRELPTSWFSGVDVARFATAEAYDAEVNKYKVACGQSIEEWERHGWINHDFDVRGWFQWYCRFWLGRRCADDERQVGRWRKCCGPTGRWRRALLKRYRDAGVREVFDDGEEEDGVMVSPVVHQTCHHWGFEVRQSILDEYWRTG